MLRHTRRISRGGNQNVAFLGVAVKCIRNKAGIIENCRIALAEITDTVELERKAADCPKNAKPAARTDSQSVWRKERSISVDQNA